MKLNVAEYQLLARMGARINVLLDEVDVTDNCVAFDTEEGWVDVFVRDEEGRIKANVHGPMTQRQTGVVTIINSGKLTLE